MKKPLYKIVYILLALSVSAIWGFGFIAVDHAVEKGLGEWALVSVRFLAAALAILPVRAAFKKAGKAGKFQRKDVLWGAVVGAVNFFGFLFQTMAMTGSGKTDTARCALFTSAYVVLVSVASCFLQKKFSLKSVFYALLFFVGMMILNNPFKGGALVRGDFFAILCSLFFAAQILLVGKAKGVDFLNFNIVQMATMGLLGGVGALFTDWKTLAALKEGSVLLCILYLTLFSSAYAYIVQIIVQKKLSDSLSAILLSLEAVASVLFSLIFGRVGFSYPLLFGGGIMVVATVLASAAESNKEEKGEKEEKE